MDVKPKEFSLEVNMGISFLSNDAVPETMELMLDHMLYRAERGLLVSREKHGGCYTISETDK